MSSLTTSSALRKRFAVSDGRDSCGSIEQSSRGFVATNVTGQLIGTFPTLSEAARSLPTAVSS